jgi:hypothetical protein
MNSDCISEPADLCSSNIIWASGFNESSPITDGGNVIVGSEFTGVIQQVALASPASAIRVDVASAKAKAPVYNSKPKVLSVSSTASGLVTGAATISGGKVHTSTATCTAAGETY